ncbi:acyltransferase family protein [Lysinibacillus sp. NPDC097162]|uniref:acyltransferase family protein n=1 Tax=Lysinibacillus sp. NPDC097162 TaxID=3364140 RepID=UPI0037F753F9
MKPVVKEIFLLRFVACLGIVLMHSVTLVLDIYDIEENTVFFVLTSLQLALMFGTPVFIFISEFVIAYSYSDELPKTFYKKRFSYIFLPFIFIGIVDAALHSININSIDFEKKVLLNFFEGDFHGYFIIIIFQFYFLHPLFVKFIVSKYPAYQVIITACIINFAYLALFNFFDPFKYLYFLPYIEVEWTVLNKMPFPAWIAYFVVAYYCGKNYEQFISLLHRFRYVLPSICLLMLGILLASQWSGLITEVHSKRIDVIFYTLSVAFLLFFIASKIRNMPKLIIFISRYSFGIYLLHPLFNIMLKSFFTKYIDVLSASTVIVSTFFISTVCSICVTYLLNKWKFGPYLVGQVHAKEKATSNKIRASKTKQLVNHR